MLSKKRTKVAIIGDHSMTRLGLVTYIQALPNFEVVFDCGDAEYALIAVESKRTDIMLIDIHLPNMNGAEFVRQLHAKQPQIKTLMINAYDTALATVIAQEAGASGVFS